MVLPTTSTQFNNLIFGADYYYLNNFSSLSDHERLLQSSSWFKGHWFDHTKGTGNFNKFRRGRLDGYMRIMNITFAEAGKYECMIETAVGRIYGTSEVIVHGPPGPPGGVSAFSLTANSGKIVWTDGAIYGEVECHSRNHRLQ